MSLEIRPLQDGEIELGWELLKRVGSDIRQRGRIQRIASLSPDTYRLWQTQRANYGLFIQNSLAAVFTLIEDSLNLWTALNHPAPVWWLRALAVDPNHRGKQLGQSAVFSALNHLPATTPLYLDCVAGFLPDYYSRLGFKPLDTKTVEIQNQPTQIVLMRHDRNDSGNVALSHPPLAD